MSDRKQLKKAVIGASGAVLCFLNTGMLFQNIQPSFVTFDASRNSSVTVYGRDHKHLNSPKKNLARNAMWSNTGF